MFAGPTRSNETQKTLIKGALLRSSQIKLVIYDDSSFLEQVFHLEFFEAVRGKVKVSSLAFWNIKITILEKSVSSRGIFPCGKLFSSVHTYL